MIVFAVLSKELVSVYSLQIFVYSSNIWDGTVVFL